MEIVLSVMSVVIVILLIFVIILVTRRGERSANIKGIEERLIRMESKIMEINPTIDRNFRENRKEIAENLVRMQDSNERGLEQFRESNERSLERFRISNEKSLEQVRNNNEKGLEKLRANNEKKLDEMRETVDEKLKASVEKRFNESFKTISEQLSEVYKGLGEMRSLANGVGDLKKVMEGVKTRGIYGEVQLGAIIEDVLSKNQYEENIITKHGSNDRVEFAVKMPGKETDVLLPIDSKFPVENYSRLVAAYDEGNKVKIAEYQKALSSDVKEQAKKISTKYLDPPKTTSFGLMFVPTESLYAEIIRIPGLSDEVRQKYNIAIASPSTLPVMLSGLLMGFRTVAIEKRSLEVWQILGAVKTQFGKFGDLLDGVQKKLQESANKIESAKTTSRQIERKLKDVEELPKAESVKLIGEV